MKADFLGWGENLPFAERIQRAAFAIAMLVVVVFTAGYFGYALYEVPREQTALHDADARTIADILASDVNNRIANVKQLGDSPLVWTALTDSAGREAYLRPFLTTRTATSGETIVALMDYRGRPVLTAQNFEADAAVVAQVTRQTLASGKATLVVADPPRRQLFVGQPVPFPSSSEVIGVLVGVIDLPAIFRTRAPHFDLRGADLVHGNRLLDSTVDAAVLRHYAVHREVTTSTAIEGGNLRVAAFGTQSPWVGQVVSRLLIALLVAFIVGPLVWRLAGLFARRTTVRLNHLVEACAQVNPEKPLEIPDDSRDDEIGLLTRTLKRAIAAHAELSDHLSALVAMRTQKLAETEDRLSGAIDAIDEAFAIYDSDDRLVYFNRKYAETYPSIADVIHIGSIFPEIVRTWAQRGGADTQGESVDAWVAKRIAAHRHGGVVIQKTENGRWVRIVERKTRGGNIVGFRVDISELMKAKEMAEEANRAKSRFLATMSHEIRTPMNGILGMAQLLMRPDVEAGERNDYAATILASGQTLLALLNDILDLSKVEAGKLELSLADFAPQAMIDDVRHLFAEGAANKAIGLSSVWHGPPGQQFSGDDNRLQQMLSNLVSNAIKFTDYGSIRIEAREFVPAGGKPMLEFAVTDTGAGIEADKLSLLFMPFSQVDSSNTRRYGGSGLGLSIVRSLAQTMGGEVGVESAVGKGSRFWFRIPAEPPRGNAVAYAATEGAAETTNFSGRVLVVEDNATNRKLIAAVLEKTGLTVLVAEDGRAGADIIMAGTPVDAVLMDIQMPVMDGYAATATIREWERRNARPRIPVIALTADAFEEDRRRCLDIGMDDFLTKPIDINRLPAVLAKWIGKPHGAAHVPSPSAQPGAAPADAAVFDEARTLARLGGSRELAKTVIQSAASDIPGYFDRLERAVASGDWKEARRMTHILKSLTAQIGGSRIADRIKRADDRLRNEAPVDAAAVAELRSEYAELEEALAPWLH